MKSRSVLRRWAAVALSFALCLALSATGVVVQRAAADTGFAAEARLRLNDTQIDVTADNGVELSLGLSRAVPFQVYTLTNPPRLVLDFNAVDWRGIRSVGLEDNRTVQSLRAGPVGQGWSRLVMELTGPLAVARAWMDTDAQTGAARVQVDLSPVSPATFAAASGAPPNARFLPPARAATDAKPIRRQTGDRALMVVLDPGHGGVDPGAEREGLREADLMLDFARLLKEELVRAGGFEVVLTRGDDSFVSLDRRVSVARSARADIFISIHADAISEGRATGATVYTLSEEATDEASARLAERHDREDLLAGVDLSGQDDRIVSVLMDLARRETMPRSERLAGLMVEQLQTEAGHLYKHPQRTAGFSVLKAPDIPSVLLELGYMSSPEDLERLLSEAWLRNAARGIRLALQEWAVQDAAEALLLRQ